MIELGGNIKLDNFEGIDGGTFVVVKKIIGNYTKQISEKNKNFKEIIVTKEGDTGIKVKCVCDKEINVEVKEKSLMFSLGKALDEVLKKC